MGLAIGSRCGLPEGPRARALLVLAGTMGLGVLLGGGVALALGSWFLADVDDMADKADWALGVEDRHRAFVEQVTQETASLVDGEAVPTNLLRRDFSGRIAQQIDVRLGATAEEAVLEELGPTMCSAGARAQALSIDLTFVLRSDVGRVGIDCDDVRYGQPVTALTTAILQMPVDEVAVTIHVEEATSTAEVLGRVRVDSPGTGLSPAAGLEELARAQGLEADVVTRAGP